MATGETIAPAAGRPSSLRRDLGLLGATLMGLGSIVGTGVFVSIGIAAGLCGPAVILAIALASLVATGNALSSAQLAASHPVSGGTYEYGYRYLNPWLGFFAGWTFLCAKSASAATAALGFAGYLLETFRSEDSREITPVALGVVAVLGIVVLSGIRQTNRLNVAVVSISIASLVVFILAGAADAFASTPKEPRFAPFFQGSIQSFFNATALMFVAFTGYGRIATLGEEVRNPRRTIPLAIIVTLAASALLYMSVATVAVATAGSSGLTEAAHAAAAPLAVVADEFSLSLASPLVAVGAMAAMLGVLLNLLRGLSRVLLAMGRRGDMPRALAKLNRSGTTPYLAVIAVTSTIAALTLLGNVKTTWSFSAFSVLIYYSITNLAALRLPKPQRLYPRWCAWAGVAVCPVLALCIDWQIWLVGLGVLISGGVWRSIAMQCSASH